MPKNLQNLLRVSLVLLVSSFAFGQGSLYSGVAQTATGNALAGESVTLCTANPGTTTPPCSSLAVTYTDITLGTQCTNNPVTLGPSSGTGCTNPGLTDGFGNYTFFSSPGTYYRQLYGYGIVTPFVGAVILPASGTGATGGALGQKQVRNQVGSFAGFAQVATDQGFGGVDIGDNTNKAYASTSCASTGCELDQPPVGSATITTPVTFSTFGRAPLWLSYPGSAALTFSSNSAAAITFGWGNHANFLNTQPGAGISGLKLIGGGGTSIGVQMDPSGAAADEAVIDRTYLQSFGTNIAWSGGGLGSYGTTISNSVIQAASTENLLVTDNIENIRLLGNIIGGGPLGLHINNTGHTADINAFGNSWDTNQTSAIQADAGSSCDIKSIGEHYETNGSGNPQFINWNANQCRLVLVGDSFNNDSGNAATQHINIGGSGTVVAFGSIVYGNAATTEFVNTGTSGSALLIGTRRVSGVTNDVAGSGNIVDINVGAFPQTIIQTASHDTFQIGEGTTDNTWHMKDATANNDFTFAGTTGNVTIPGTATVGGTSNQLVFNGNANSTTINIPNSGAGASVLSLPDASAYTGRVWGQTQNGVTGVYQSIRNTAGCTTGAAQGNACAAPVTITLINAYPNTNYSAGCTPVGAPTNLPGSPYVVAKALGSFTVNYVAMSAAAASWPNLDCWAIHD